MVYKNGHKKLGGRQKGTKNKFTTLKNAFLEAFQELQKNNKTKLPNWGKENAEKFYELVAKMLPKEIEISPKDDKPFKFEITDKRKSK